MKPSKSAACLTIGGLVDLPDETTEVQIPQIRKTAANRERTVDRVPQEDFLAAEGSCSPAMKLLAVVPVAVQVSEGLVKKAGLMRLLD